MNDPKQLRYRNVFYKTYEFAYRAMPDVIEEFKKEFEANGLHENGMFFYSMDAMRRYSDTEADVQMTFYQPAQEHNAPEGCELGFADAFEWDDMTYRLVDDDHSNKAQAAFVDMLNEESAAGKKITSPVFYEFFFRENEEGDKKPCCLIRAQFK